MDANDIADRRRARLRLAIDEWFGGVDSALARAADRPPAQISDMLVGRKSFGEKVARAIEERLAGPPCFMPSGWLDESGAKGVEPSKASDDEAYGLAPMGDAHSQGHLMSLAPGEMWLPRHEGVYPRMGRGGMDDGHEVVTLVRVTVEGLRRQLGATRVTSMGALRLVAAFGDSMRPTFDDGDMLVVDTGVQAVGQDGVYVLRGPDDILVKRVQRKSDGAWLLISSNREYETERIAPDERDGFAVVGRVVFAWRGGVV